MSELLVPRMGSAGFLAGSAELGARAACDDVIWRAAQHEVGARLAELGAIEQHSDEVDLGVLATARDAVLEGQRTYRVAVEALFDSVLQIVMRLIVALVVR
jgi:hypothetical protein